MSGGWGRNELDEDLGGHRRGTSFYLKPVLGHVIMIRSLKNTLKTLNLFQKLLN